jgi:hypothetical protein
LNTGVQIDDQEDQDANQDKQLVMTINSLSNGQSYKYPNEDIQNFLSFPFNRLVFARILAELDLECTDTLEYLLQNAFSYEPISFLNTSSVYNCLTTKPQNFCPELGQYCSCVAENVVKCEGFPDFDKLNFTL